MGVVQGRPNLRGNAAVLSATAAANHANSVFISRPGSPRSRRGCDAAMP